MFFNPLFVILVFGVIVWVFHTGFMSEEKPQKKNNVDLGKYGKDKLLFGYVISIGAMLWGFESDNLLVILIGGVLLFVTVTYKNTGTVPKIKIGE